MVCCGQGGGEVGEEREREWGRVGQRSGRFLSELRGVVIAAEVDRLWLLFAWGKWQGNGRALMK